MPPEPPYRADNQNPAYQLRYSWTGWPTSGHFPSESSLLELLGPLWEEDGLRLLECRWSQEEIQLTLGTKPHASPAVLAQQAKGRLQRAPRKVGDRFPRFSRKLAVRSVGKNHTEDVRAYSKSQVDQEAFADGRFRDLMRAFPVFCPEVDFSLPTDSARGH